VNFELEAYVVRREAQLGYGLQFVAVTEEFLEWLAAHAPAPARRG
jgi:hypothetical protein